MVQQTRTILLPRHNVCIESVEMNNYYHFLFIINEWLICFRSKYVLYIFLSKFYLFLYRIVLYDSEHWISPLLSESGTESSPPTEELQEGRNGRTNSMDDLIASFLGVAIQQATVICSCHAKVYRGKELVTMGWEWIKLEKYDANGKFALAVRNMNGTVLNMPIAHGMPGGLQRQRQSNKSGIFLTHMLQDGEHEVVKIITNNDDHEELHEILRQIIIIGNTNP